MSSQQSAPSMPRLCTGKNCTFYADPVTGMCSKCYREEQAARKAAAGGAPTPAPTPVAAPKQLLAVPTAPMAIPGRPQSSDDSISASVPNGNGTGTQRRAQRRVRPSPR